jgi:hypothetical protein
VIFRLLALAIASERQPAWATLAWREQKPAARRGPAGLPRPSRTSGQEGGDACQRTGRVEHPGARPSRRVAHVSSGVGAGGLPAQAL